ncbi:MULTISPECIES: HAD family hydrolase [Streptomyces]|uniref:Pyrimidine 5'-nucleotidase n=1 Tax=Streptomyces luteosporeus TaxID=173856 RepID=A0ABN3TXF3_9ACTN
MPDPVGLFDLDDTLIRRDEAFERWAAEFASAHRVPLEWLLKTDPAYSSRRMEFFELVKATFSVRSGVAELHAQYRRRMPELVEPDPQVCAMLTGLREAGWRLGVVTNGMVDNQTAKLRRAGLYDLVDAVVISDAVEIRKPDARIFHHALTRLGAKSGPHVVMVGDSLENDITGAHRAGLATVWVSHGRPLPGTGPRPHHTICAGNEAAAVLTERTAG